MNNTATTERAEIERMFDFAESRRDWPGSYFPARAKAEAALTAWQEKYPREAALERAEGLRRQAARLREKACGALCYSADGWLSREDRQRRHDEMMAEAAKLEAEAEEVTR